MANPMVKSVKVGKARMKKEKMRKKTETKAEMTKQSRFSPKSLRGFRADKRQ